MPSADQDPFVLLATLSEPSAAELCAALLRSEGIDSRLRGESLGPYRLTIGAMAATQVWVPLSRRDDALRLVGSADLGEIDLPRGPTEEPATPSDGRWGVALTALAVLLGALAVALLLARLF